ncbi:Uncharacterised protein [Vibrio cholerae]|nr:Uncharacterised protein [Vibrio cholerae]
MLVASEPGLVTRRSNSLAMVSSTPTLSSRPPKPRPKTITATDPSMDDIPPRLRIASIKLTPDSIL